MIQNKDLSIYTSNSSCQIFSTKELDSHTVDKEMHRHSYYQILVLKKGEIRHFLDYSLQESRAPYLSVVFPNQVHQIELIVLSGCGIESDCFWQFGLLCSHHSQRVAGLQYRPAGSYQSHSSRRHLWVDFYPAAVGTDSAFILWLECGKENGGEVPDQTSFAEVHRNSPLLLSIG